MAYQYLTADEQRRILASYRTAFPDPTEEARKAEETHYRKTIEYKLGLRDDDPGEYAAPEIKSDEVALIDAEVAKLPVLEVVESPVVAEP